MSLMYAAFSSSESLSYSSSGRGLVYFGIATIEALKGRYGMGT